MDDVAAGFVGIQRNKMAMMTGKEDEKQRRKTKKGPKQNPQGKRKNREAQLRESIRITNLLFLILFYL